MTICYLEIFGSDLLKKAHVSVPDLPFDDPLYAQTRTGACDDLAKRLLQDEFACVVAGESDDAIIEHNGAFIKATSAPAPGISNVERGRDVEKTKGAGHRKAIEKMVSALRNKPMFEHQQYLTTDDGRTLLWDRLVSSMTAFVETACSVSKFRLEAVDRGQCFEES